MHLHSQRQGKLRWDDDLAAFVPSTVVPNQQTIGSGRGSFELEDCLAEGISAGASAAIAAGFSPEIRRSRRSAGLGEPKASAPTRQLWLVPGQTGTPDDWHHHFVDFQRDQSVADVLRSTGAGMRSVEHIKRYTSISTANDQGKTSGVNAIGVIAAALRQAGEASRGHRRHRHHHLPGTVHPGGVRGTRRTPARRTVRPRPRHLHPPLARRPGRPVRGRRAVEAPLVLPAGRRGHGRRGAARMRRRPRIRGLHGRHHPGQDRNPRQGRRRVPQPDLHQRVQEARARVPPATA